MVYVTFVLDTRGCSIRGLVSFGNCWRRDCTSGRLLSLFTVIFWIYAVTSPPCIYRRVVSLEWITFPSSLVSGRGGERKCWSSLLFQSKKKIGLFCRKVSWGFTCCQMKIFLLFVFFCGWWCLCRWFYKVASSDHVGVSILEFWKGIIIWVIPNPLWILAVAEIEGTKGRRQRHWKWIWELYYSKTFCWREMPSRAKDACLLFERSGEKSTILLVCPWRQQAPLFSGMRRVHPGRFFKNFFYHIVLFIYFYFINIQSPQA